MGRDRAIYLKLLDELEDAKRAVDKIGHRIHQLLDIYDEEEAARIQQEHQQWMDDNE